MAPSKSWMSLSTNDRLSDEYSQGVKNFLAFAFSRLEEGRKVIKCPCVKCCNSSEHTRDVVETHLIAYGILIGYTICLSDEYDCFLSSPLGAGDYYILLKSLWLIILVCSCNRGERMEKYQILRRSLKLHESEKMGH